MTATEAQKKASYKYMQKQAQINYRISPEDKERYEQAAQAAGMSLRAFILEAIEEKIFNETLKGTFDHVAHPEEQP